MQRKKNLLSYGIGLALVQPGAMLAVSQASAQETPPAATQRIEQVVVTGTSVERSTFDTPQSATQIDSEALESLKSSSIADVLMSLPGVSAEGGGGEVASNLFVRGLPSGGQFQFTPLLFDGVPTISTFGVMDSAFDIFQRTDLGIERLEYVTGGVSNLFGPGSVAGIVNQVSRTGGPDEEGTVQVELAEDNRLRTDFFFSGPVSDDTYYALSGFYRVDEGPLDSGLDSEGFQLRGNIKHEFERGSFKVSGHAIDDKAQFFLPIPLSANDRERVNGNDGREVETLNSSDFAQINFLTPQGSFKTGMEDAIMVKGGSIAAAFEADINDQWGFNGNIKYATFDHAFGLPLDGLFAGGGVNAPIGQDAFLESNFVSGLIGDAADGADITSGRFTFSRSGQNLAPDDLLFGNVLADRDRDTTDFSAEFNLTFNTEIASLDHNFTFGSFWANTRADDITFTHSVLGDFTDGSNAVDLTVTTEDGRDIIVSQNGLLDPAFGGFGGDFTREAKRFAFYAADQIEANRWALDIGIRVEHMDGLVIERTRSEVTNFPTQFINNPLFNSDIANGDLAVSDALSSVIVKDGGFNRDTVSDTEYAVAVGGLYRLTDSINLFGNFSRGFFFPQLDALAFDSPDDPLAVTPGEINRDYEAEIIQLGELGIKYDQGRLKAQASAFYTQLEDRLFAENTAQGREVFETSTESYGLEFSGEFMIIDNLFFRGNATVFDAEFTQFDLADGGSLENNEPNRQPSTVNTGLFYNDGTWDFAVMHNFQGEAFADNGNNVKLDSYNTVRLDAGYTMYFSGGDSARFSINVWNLTDDEGLTEGSPRAGVDQAGDTQGFFTGRPVLPRRITARFAYNF